VDQLGLAAAKNLEKLYRESILRIIWPLPGLLTILQKTFEEANRTGHWTGYLLGSLNSWLTSLIGMKYSTEMNPTPLAVFDEQHISSFKEFFIPRASGRDIFQGLVRKAWFAA
jgi:hypothetical protein